MNSIKFLKDIKITLPEWISQFLSENRFDFSSLENRTEFAIKLSDLNTKYKTGGPFGAAIFDIKTNQLLSVGVNLVISSNCSVLHAEIMAIMFAQSTINNWDLNYDVNKRYEIVTSAEPCLMCMGAIIWSGIKQLVCSARDINIRNIGFDEGPKPRYWKSELNKRNINIISDINRKKAVDVLNNYKKLNGIIYNSNK